MEKETLKLKRHETFSIREGWLQKAINIIPNKIECFKKNDGPTYFGLGTNMCKSLKYWLLATQIAEFKSQNSYLTDFGNILYKYDRYLENIFSWWIIHINLVNNLNDSPIFSAIFNTDFNQFEKETLFKILKESLSLKYNLGADSSLESDISIVLKSYCSEDNTNPEDNYICPLSKLNLMKYKNRIFYRNSPLFHSLDYRIVYWSIIACMNKKIKNGTLDFNVEDIYNEKNNPIKILNISKSTFFVYLDEMKKNNMISFIKTAGLNTVHINHLISLNELFESYFGGY